MLVDLVKVTEKDIEESCERIMNSGFIATDMSDCYANELYRLHQYNIAQRGGTISSVSVSEGVVLDGEKILKLDRSIYRRDDKNNS